MCGVVLARQRVSTPWGRNNHPAVCLFCDNINMYGIPFLRLWDLDAMGYGTQKH